MISVIVKEEVAPGLFKAAGAAVSPEGEARQLEVHIQTIPDGWDPCLPASLAGREILELQFIREKSEQATPAIGDTLTFRCNFIIKPKK